MRSFQCMYEVYHSLWFTDAVRMSMKRRLVGMCEYMEQMYSTIVSSSHVYMCVRIRTLIFAVGLSASMLMPIHEHISVNSQHNKTTHTALWIYSKHVFHVTKSKYSAHEMLKLVFVFHSFVLFDNSQTGRNVFILINKYS